MTPPVIVNPVRAVLPTGRKFSAEFLRVRLLAYQWIEDYYDSEHLTRAGDWMLAIAPDAPEHLVIAALLHDMERSVPGGPVLDKAHTSWDDKTYNTAHCDRSATVVATWLQMQGAPVELIAGVQQPIREHEFGGSPEGNLMQAADSISFLETNGRLVHGWITNGDCDVEQGRRKLEWMSDRVLLERARETARHFADNALKYVDDHLEEAGK